MYAVRQVAPEIFEELETEVYELFKEGVATDLWRISSYSHPMSPVYELERRIADIVNPNLDEDHYGLRRRTSAADLAPSAAAWADHLSYLKKRNQERALAYQAFLQQLTSWLEAHNLVTYEWMTGFVIDTLHIWSGHEAALEKRACANFLRNSSTLSNVYLYGLHFEQMWTLLPLLPNPQSKVGRLVQRWQKRVPWIIRLAPRLPLKTTFPLPMSPYEYDYGYVWHAVHRCKKIARRWGLFFGVRTAKDAEIWLKYMKEISERRYKAHLNYIKRREWPKQYKHHVTRERTYALHTKMQWFAYSVVYRYAPDEVSTKFPQLHVPEGEVSNANLPTTTVRDALELMSQLTGVARPKAKQQRQLSKLPSDHVLRRCQDKLREHLESNF